MIRRFKVMYPLVDGAEERTAYVYLPDSYFRNRRKRYPVLYMFDGHNVFFDSDATYGKSWGLGEYLKKNRTQLIVAAVECNHSPDHGRLKEYSPFTFEAADVGIIEGLGKDTMDWFVYEFKSMIDRTYRTIPDREHTFIAGSSMGGLMSIYALTAYNSVFSRAAALSPSLWTDPEQLHDLIVHADLDPDTILYMDYGSEEMGNHDEFHQIFGEFVNLLMWRQIALTCRIVPGGTHSEVSWERQIPFFLNTLLYMYQVPRD